MSLTSKEWTTAGHNNRVFGVKFVDDDSNLVLSGGWDQNVHIWDMRVKASKATILGPKITGDSIDYQNGMILTGSNKMGEQCQLWDLKTQKLIQDIQWDVITYPHSNS